MSNLRVIPDPNNPFVTQAITTSPASEGTIPQSGLQAVSDPFAQPASNKKKKADPYELASFNPALDSIVDTQAERTQQQQVENNLKIQATLAMANAWSKIDEAVSKQNLLGIGYTLSQLASVYQDVESLIGDVQRAFDDELPPAMQWIIVQAQDLLNSIVTIVRAVLPEDLLVSDSDLHALLGNGQNKRSQSPSLKGLGQKPTTKSLAAQSGQNRLVSRENNALKKQTAGGSLSRIIRSLLSKAKAFITQSQANKQGINGSGFGELLMANQLLESAQGVFEFMQALGLNTTEGEEIGQVKDNLKLVYPTN